MKTLTLFVGCLLWAVMARAAEHWYETLRPGITRSEVLNLAGSPTFSDAGTDTYKLTPGRLECRYQGGLLQEATYYDPPGGGVSRSLYWTDGKPGEDYSAARRRYLQERRFATLPPFGGNGIRTARYRGLCYEVDGQFLVLEPIIGLLGGNGFFADKTASMLLVHPDGQEETLYRAADHWADLRPPGLSPAVVARRTATVRRLGEKLNGASLSATLGQADAFMGSGVDYRLFYLQDALLIVSCSSQDTIARAELVRPGSADAPPSLAQYSLTPPATSSASSIPIAPPAVPGR